MLPFLSSSERRMWWFWFGYCNWRNSQQTLFLSNVTFGSLTQRARAFDTTYNSYKLHDFVDSAGKMSCIFKFNGKSLQSKSFIRCLYSEAMCPSNSQQLTIFSVLKYNFENAYTFVLNVLYLYLTQRIRWIFMLNFMRTISELFFSYGRRSFIAKAYTIKFLYVTATKWMMLCGWSHFAYTILGTITAHTHTHIHIFMDNFVWF